MKVRIVKDNLLMQFQERFDILFIEPEFGFKADEQLITMVVASLAHEHFSEPSKPILDIDLVSRGIIFIQEGQVSMSHVSCKHPIVKLLEGSYFGDVSYMFKLLNRFNYIGVQPTKERDKACKFYSLNDKYIADIFKRFPDFENVFRVRALRRHHYFRRLRHQNNDVKDIKVKKTWQAGLKSAGGFNFLK